MRGAIVDVAPVVVYLWKHLWPFLLLTIIIIIVGFGFRISKTTGVTNKVYPFSEHAPRFILTLGFAILIPVIATLGVDRMVEHAANEAIRHAYGVEVVSQRKASRETAIVTYKKPSGDYKSGLIQIFQADEDERLHVVLCDMQGNPQPYNYNLQ